VVQLQVGGVAGGLRHGANDAGQLVGRSGAQQTGEDIAQGGGMVQVVQNDHRGKLGGSIGDGSLLGNVAQILTQILRGFVVNTKG